MRAACLGWVLLLCACAGGSTTGATDGGSAAPPTQPGSPAVDGGTPVPAPTPSGVIAVAAFDGTTGSGTAPDTEKFDGTGSHSNDPHATIACAWDFGDGATAGGCKATHVFQTAGAFTVTLTATDSDGSSARATLQVTVSSASPSPSGVVAKAAFDGTTGAGVAPDTEKFDGTGSHSNDPHATVACAWTFGDGASAQGCKASHTFTSAGHFTVTLTVIDSDGNRATATLAVVVSAPPTPPSPSIRWARSGLGIGVATDFVSVAAEVGAGLQRFDPTDGHVVWSVTFGDPMQGDPYRFMGPVAVVPNGGPFLAQTDVGETPLRNDYVEMYAARDGSDEGALAQESTEIGRVMGPAIGAGGDVAAAEVGHDQTVVVRRADGSFWKSLIVRTDPTQAALFDLQAVGAEPGGDALVAGTAREGFQFAGTGIDPGRVLMRVHADGSLAWWRPLNVDVIQMGTSTAGTVVILARADVAFQWAGVTQAAGDYLLTVENGSADRWARALPAHSGALAVLPAGQAAIVVNGPDCAGPEVLRYDLAGDLLWTQAFPDVGCAKFTGVGILPDDVIVSGLTDTPITIGGTSLPAGGFLFDVSGR